MKKIFSIFTISLALTACNQTPTADFSGEWKQIPETDSLRKLTISKQDDEYQIKDEFWLNKNNTERTSSAASGLAEQDHEVLKYKDSQQIELKLTDATHLTLTDREYDAVIHFEKIN
ncbi:hypothetical protein B9T33_12265 [Acinetobacter sp. ANC 5054]|uniref:membrane lipoprotein lipid attachment site-containing protein n=1 Tax=Acinetobacter sp. ANC 5054 TaxID=1977877 RepID=UPI000A32F973|nr:membrane lipoprotein lipid attachment site-containing protein [Acinetobacter sp. ANC 5054]OTG79249.1 hypothetical protein B9T33_12265 [Acinetobacter sp. ANC 5054]